MTLIGYPVMCEQAGPAVVSWRPAQREPISRRVSGYTRALITRTESPASITGRYTDRTADYERSGVEPTALAVARR